VKDFKLTANSIGLFIQELWKLDLTKAYRVSVVGWREKRSINANGQQHLWYTQIANELGYQSLYIKDSCKVMFGVDVLLGSESSKAQSVVRTLELIDFWSRDWPTKIDIISGLDVTSLFNTSESKAYMDQMIMYWNDKNAPIKYKDD